MAGCDLAGAGATCLGLLGFVSGCEGGVCERRWSACLAAATCGEGARCASGGLGEGLDSGAGELEWERLDLTAGSVCACWGLTPLSVEDCDVGAGTESGPPDDSSPLLPFLPC